MAVNDGRKTIFKHHIDQYFQLLCVFQSCVSVSTLMLSIRVSSPAQRMLSSVSLCYSMNRTERNCKCVCERPVQTQREAPPLRLSEYIHKEDVG